MMKGVVDVPVYGSSGGGAMRGYTSWMGRDPRSRLPVAGPPQAGPAERPYSPADPWWFLGKARDAGFFNPTLPQSAFDPLRQELAASGRARENRASTDAALEAHGDPLMRAFLSLQARQGAQSDTARSIAAARAQGDQRQRDLLWQLLMGAAGPDFAARAGQ